MSGFIYFARAGDRIKIGFSRDAERRVRQLGTGSSLPIEVLGKIPGTKTIERDIHAKLAPHRLHREWFVDCPEVRAFLDTLPIEPAAPKPPRKQYTHRDLTPTPDLASVGRAMNAYLKDLESRMDRGEATRDEIAAAIAAGKAVAAGLEVYLSE